VFVASVTGYYISHRSSPLLVLRMFMLVIGPATYFQFFVDVFEIFFTLVYVQRTR